MKAQNGRHLFGAAPLGEKAELFLPEEAERIFSLKSGDRLLLLGDIEEGMALIPQNRHPIQFFFLNIIRRFPQMSKEDGKHIFGVVKVGEKGQIVIPKAARDVFNISPGDSLLILGDENQGGMAVVKVDIFQQVADEILNPSDKKRKGDEGK